MPTYEYACRACGEHLEVVQSFKDDPLTECPSCGGELRKVFGAIGIAFKGSGFYRNDSRESKESKGSKKGKDAGEGGSKEKEKEKVDSKSDSSGSSDSSSSSGDASGGKSGDKRDKSAKTTTDSKSAASS